LQDNNYKHPLVFAETFTLYKEYYKAHHNLAKTIIWQNPTKPTPIFTGNTYLLSEIPQQLNNWKNKINQFLQNTLKLQLHSQKILLNTTSKGIDFLGYVVFKHYILVRKRVVKEFKNKLQFFNYLFTRQNKPQKIVVNNFVKKYHHSQQLTINLLQDMLGILNAYYGIFTFANSYNLCKDLYHNHFGYLKKFFVVKNYKYQSLVIRKIWFQILE
jgi:hypothetical protein